MSPLLFPTLSCLFQWALWFHVHGFFRFLSLPAGSCSIIQKDTLTLQAPDNYRMTIGLCFGVLPDVVSSGADRGAPNSHAMII